MINDYVEIKAGRIINLSFDVSVIVDKNYNKVDVIKNIINIISDYMDINKHSMGEEIYVGDLEKEIAEGNFREDLFYRLNVVNLYIPPLRERKEDLPLLITAFLNEFNKENNKKITNIDNLAKNVLYSYDWPGNIRQLRNCIESAVLMCTGDTITINDLPPTIHAKNDSNMIKVPAKAPLAEVEKIVIEQNLLLLNGNKSRTAEVLQIGRKTLHRKIEEYGLQDKND